MTTPIRPIRIEDKLWKKAQVVAEDLAAQTGFNITASDVVRKALTEYVAQHQAAKKASK
jgi:hypothetical protein